LQDQADGSHSQRGDTDIGGNRNDTSGVEAIAFEPLALISEVLEEVIVVSLKAKAAATIAADPG
jgi:hypothetical protein